MVLRKRWEWPVYFMLASVLILTHPAIALAGGCRSVVTYRSSYVAPYVAPYVPPYVAPVVEKIAFVTPVLPVYTIPPAYGAIYVPPAAVAAPCPPAVAGAPAHGAAAPAPAAVDSCAEVRLEMTRLKAQVLEMQRALSSARPGFTPMPGATDPPAKETAPPPVPEKERATAPTGERFEQWAGTRCASCHESASAKLKGGGFTLFSGEKLAPLSGQQSGEIIRRLSLPDGHEQAMPKGRRLPPAERLDGVRLFVESGG